MIRRLAPPCAALVAVGLLAAGAFWSASAAHAGESAGAQRVDVERALIVSLPAVTWDLVARERPPNLLALLEESAVASMSVRTIGAYTDAGEGYATIGAGNRASAERSSAGLAFDRDAGYEEGEVADVYTRRAGVPADGNVFHLGIARVIDLNDRYLYGATPGTLGSALAGVGQSAAIVANADGAIPGGQDALHREAALAVMDEFGRVAGGTVGAHLLSADPRFPFGLRMDLAAAAEAFDEAWATHDVVLVEASDLFRADRYAAFSTADAEREARSAALEAADRLIGHVRAQVDLERHLVVVVAPMPQAGRSELTVGAVAGPGVGPGTARSSTTRRDGYVTLPDIGPTVLDALGIDVPRRMTGGLITSAGDGDDLSQRIDRLVDENERAVFRDDAVIPVSVVFIVLQGLAYVLAAVALGLGRWQLRPWARAFALATLAIPPLTYLSGTLRYDQLGGLPGYVVVLLVAAIALAAVAHAVEVAVARRSSAERSLVAPLFLVSVTVAVLLGDVAVGAPLQINTVFGYSPIVAGRFAGFGNQAFALLAVTTMLLPAGVWALWRDGRGRHVGRRGILATAAFLAAVVVADGHPSLGSDVGGVLALVPAGVVVLGALTGTRLTPRRALAVAGAAVLVVAGFALVDLARAEEARTHLGRFVTAGAEGGWSDVSTVIARKATSNWSILMSSVWSWAVPLMLAFLAFLTWRESGLLRPLLRRVPAMRAGLAGVLVAAAIGFAVNDSGVAVPTMMLGVLLPFLAVLVVGEEPHPAAAGPPPPPAGAGSQPV